MASTSSSSMATRALSVGQPLTTRYDYDLPIWAKDKFQNAPLAGRLHMAHLPTPLYQWTATNNTPSSSSSLMQRLNELGVTLYIKRDDMTGGCETGGNKIRKLEFLLAEALHQGFKKVVTIGGEQSNHCRATAAACRMVGLEPHLILRTKRADEIQQAASSSSSSSDDEGGMGYTGNILFDRLVGSSIYTCTPGEYGRVGSKELVSRLCARLEAQTDGTNSVGGGTVYPIPVGGSNGLGTFGYIDGVDELLSQWNSIQSKPSLDHVLFACGSGGTAAGITVGMALAFESEAFQDTPAPSVHAMGVCDSPDYFYKYVASIADEMGLVVGDGDGDGGMTTEDYIRKHMIAHQGKGLGYAASTPEELEFISTLALETGVVLDPVYSGKALYHFFTGVLNGDEAESYRGKNILFWHTGGALGMFDKANDLLSTMDRISKVNRLDIYGKGGTNAIDISQDTDGA
jgi:D-cysteine desulfhydrase